jgi:hypothetical protein
VLCCSLKFFCFVCVASYFDTVEAASAGIYVDAFFLRLSMLLNERLHRYIRYNTHFYILLPTVLILASNHVMSLLYRIVGINTMYDLSFHVCAVGSLVPL